MGKDRDRFDHLLEMTRAYHLASPALLDFAPWPRRMRWAGKPAATSPVIAHLRAWYDDRPGPDGALFRAIKLAAPHAGWQQTFTVEEVGEDYLANYGYFELFGPTGHYVCDELRGFIGYWGPGLVYDWHRHEAEEIYSVISGDAVFRSDGEPDRRLGPGGTHHHPSNRKHAMTMGGSAMVVYALWKGDGISGRAQLELKS